jgi:hypothetical protein
VKLQAIMRNLEKAKAARAAKLRAGASEADSRRLHGHAIT